VVGKSDPYDFDAFVASEEVRDQVCLEPTDPLDQLDHHHQHHQRGGDDKAGASNPLKRSRPALASASNPGGDGPITIDSDSDSDLEMDFEDIAKASGNGGVESPQAAQAGSAKQRRRVTFAEVDERREFEPDVEEPSISQQCADVMEFCDELQFALDGIQAKSLSANARLRAAIKLVNLTATSNAQRIVSEQGLRLDLVIAARDLAEGSHGEAAARIHIAASFLLHNLIARGVAVASDEVLPSYATISQLFHAGVLAPPGKEQTGDGTSAAALFGEFSKAVVACRQLPSRCSEHLAPTMVALLVLNAKLKPPTTTEDAKHFETLKEALSKSTLLDDLLAICFQCKAVLTGGSELRQERRDQYLWILQRTVNALASGTFLSQANVDHIIHAVPDPFAVDETKLPIPVLLLGLTEAQYPCKTELECECLHSTLNLLLNLTHESKESCSLIGRHTDFRDLAVIVADTANTAKKKEDAHGAGTKTLSDIVNLVLGLLINLAEKDNAFSRQKLRALRIHSASKKKDEPFLHLLFRMSSICPSQEAAEDEGNDGDNNCTEVTLDMLSASNQTESSISTAYASILLGFLIVDDAECKQEVASLFGDGEKTLEPLISSVNRFVNFLSTAGALTGAQSEVLTGLVHGLQSIDL